MVGSQLELPLSAMSGSMTIQWQGLVLMSEVYVTARDHGNVLDQASILGTHGFPEAVQNCPIPSLAGVFWRTDSTSHMSSSSLESWPCTYPRQQTEADHGGKWGISEGMNVGELTATIWNAAHRGHGCVFLTKCNTQVSWPCTSPGLQSRTDSQEVGDGAEVGQHQ